MPVQFKVLRKAFKWFPPYESIGKVIDNIDMNGFALKNYHAMPGVALYGHGFQSVPNNTDTWMVLDGFTIYDNGGFYNPVNNDRMTPPEEAFYLIGAMAIWDANATGIRKLELMESGSSLRGGVTQNATASGFTRQSIVTILPTNSYWKIRVYQNSGVALDLNGLNSGAVCANAFMLYLGRWP